MRRHTHTPRATAERVNGTRCMSEDLESSLGSNDGLDLRPLGADSESAPGIGATPLIPLETDRVVDPAVGAHPALRGSSVPAVPEPNGSTGARWSGNEHHPVPDPSAPGRYAEEFPASGFYRDGARQGDGAAASGSPLPNDFPALPALPATVSREAARATRMALDPTGHWDAVVACPVLEGPQGDSSPLVGGAIHLFLTPGALMRQLGGPRGAERIGLKVTRGRLLSLLEEGLNAGGACGGFWIHGMSDEPQFLPSSALEPLAETMETILVLARASTGGMSLSGAVSRLGSHSFFHLGGWKSDASETSDAQESSVAIADPANSAPHGEAGSGSFRLLPLFVSPVSLIASGHLGDVATVRLNEVVGAMDGYDGVVVEPGAGYSLTLTRAQLLEAVADADSR